MIDTKTITPAGLIIFLLMMVAIALLIRLYSFTSEYLQNKYRVFIEKRKRDEKRG